VLPPTLADAPPSPSWTDGPSENPVAALDAARERLRRRADALRAEIGQPAEADPRDP
jgi:hypothetical protein